MNPIRIAVDAMGGDNGHKVVVLGAIKAAKANPVKIILVGHEKNLQMPCGNINMVEMQSRFIMQQKK